MSSPLSTPYKGNWFENSMFSRGAFAYHKRLATLQSRNVGQHQIVSPPDDYCFFHSLIQFTKFTAVQKQDQATQFIQLVTTILLYVQALTNGSILAKIATQLQINFISYEKLLLITEKGLQHKYKLRRPTLIYQQLKQGYAHVGFIKRQSGIQKIPVQKIINCLHKVFSNKQQQQSGVKIKMDTIQNIISKQPRKHAKIDYEDKKIKGSASWFKMLASFQQAKGKLENYPLQSVTLAAQKTLALNLYFRKLKMKQIHQWPTITSVLSFNMLSISMKQIHEQRWIQSQQYVTVLEERSDYKQLSDIYTSAVAKAKQNVKPDMLMGTTSSKDTKDKIKLPSQSVDQFVQKTKVDYQVTTTKQEQVTCDQEITIIDDIKFLLCFLSFFVSSMIINIFYYTTEAYALQQMGALITEKSFDQLGNLKHATQWLFHNLQYYKYLIFLAINFYICVTRWLYNGPALWRITSIYTLIVVAYLARGALLIKYIEIDQCVQYQYTNQHDGCYFPQQQQPLYQIQVLTFAMLLITAMNFIYTVIKCSWFSRILIASAVWLVYKYAWLSPIPVQSLNVDEIFNWFLPQQQSFWSTLWNQQYITSDRFWVPIDLISFEIWKRQIAIKSISIGSYILNYKLNYASIFSTIRFVTQLIDIIFQILYTFISIYCFQYFLQVYRWYIKPATLTPLKILQYQPKLINHAAQLDICQRILATIYSKPIPKTKQQNKSTRAGLIVQIKNFQKRIAHQLTGAITKQFNSVLDLYGIGFTGKQMSQAPNLNGGHCHSRAVVDNLQANSLDRILQAILQINYQSLKTGGQRFHFHIVDIGAKFSKIARLLVQRCKIEFTDLFGKIKDDCPAQMRQRVAQAVEGARQQFNQIQWTAPNGVLNSMEVLLTITLQKHFIDAHGIQHVLDIPLSHYVYMINGDQLLKLFAVTRCIHYWPVRPKVQTYDINYYQKQQGRYQDMSLQIADSNQCVFLEEIFIGQMQDFETKMRDDQPHQYYFDPNYDEKVFYLMFDSHYYFANWTPRVQGRVLLVGGSFCTRIGTYYLPEAEGQYTIYPNEHGVLQVRMNTRSSSTSYKHDLVHVIGSDLRVQYGWYGHIQHDCASSQLKIRNVTIPKFTENSIDQAIRYSPQAQWMIQKLQKYDVKNFPQVGQLMKLWIQRHKQCSQLQMCTAWLQSALDYYLYTHNFSICDLTIVHTILNSQQLVVRNLLLRLKQLFKRINLQNIFNFLFISLIKDKELHYTITPIRQYKKLTGKDNSMRQVNGLIDHQGQSRFQTKYNDKDRQFKMRFGTTKWQQHFSHSKAIHHGRIPIATIMDLAKEDISKPKTKQLPMISSEKETPTTLAYFCKPIDRVSPVAQCYISTQYPDARAQSDDTVNRVNQWLQNHPQPTVSGPDCILKPFSPYATVTPTGLSLASGQVQYQFGSKIDKHRICGLYDRHMSPNIQPALHALLSFQATVTRYWAHIASKGFNQKLGHSDFDPIKIVQNKDYTYSKKLKYYANTMMQLIGDLSIAGSFMTMVKSGQKHFAHPDTIASGHQNGYLHGVDQRPRLIMTPSDGFCGLLTMIQTMFWPIIKAIQPGFVQGLTKSQMKALFTKNKTSEWYAISLDGSGFDSTQNSQVMRIVDDGFWDMCREGIQTMLRNSQAKHPTYYKTDIKQLVDKIMMNVKQQDNLCFTRLPQIRHKTWPEDVWQIWLRDHAKSMKNGRDRIFIESNYIYNRIRGTTFSGHPTKTTLGNTFRSLTYAYWYLENCGYNNPWQHPDVQVMAAGDDVIIFIRGLRKAEQVRDFILANTQRDKKMPAGQRVLGLGQCIKTIALEPWYKIDFCSKWSYGSSQIDFDITRNVYKTLTTKQYFTKQNSQILQHPGLHALAIYQGIKSQKLSHLLQQLLLVRCSWYPLPPQVAERYGLSQYTTKNKIRNLKQMDQISSAFAKQCSAFRKLSDIYKNPFAQDTGYKAQQQINKRCNLSIFTLLNAIANRQLNMFMDSVKDIDFGSTAQGKQHQSFKANSPYQSQQKLDKKRIIYQLSSQKYKKKIPVSTISVSIIHKTPQVSASISKIYPNGNNVFMTNLQKSNQETKQTIQSSTLIHAANLLNWQLQFSGSDKTNLYTSVVRDLLLSSS